MTSDKQDVEPDAKLEHTATAKTKKKPLYKRAWFWVVLVIVFVLIPAGIGGAENSSTTTVQTSGTSSTSTSQSSTPPKPQPSAAHVGSTISVKDQEGNPMDVTVMKIVDPITSGNQYIQPDSGTRYVAVQLKIANTGTNAINDDAANDSTIYDAASQSYSSQVPSLDDSCPEFADNSFKLAPGSSALGCVGFQIPAATTPAKFQFTPSSGFSSSTGEWLIP